MIINENEKVEKTFEIQSDKGTNFNIEFLLKSGLLIIRAYNSVDGIKIYYENNFELSYIQKVKLLMGYDTIESCLVDIFPYIDDKQVELKEENGKLNLVILLKSKVNPEITFELIKKDKKDTERIEELQNSLYYTKVELTELINKQFVEQSNIIKKQNEKIEQQSNIISNQNEKIEQQSNKITKQNETIAQQSTKIDNLTRIINDQSNSIYQLKNIIESLSKEVRESNQIIKKDHFTYHIMKTIKGFDCFSKEYFDSINRYCPKCRSCVSNSGTRNTASDDHTGISTYVYVVNRNRIVYSRDCSTNNSYRNNLDDSNNVTICGNIYICDNSRCKYSFAVLER